MKIAICTEIDFKPAQNDNKSHRILATKFQNLDLTVNQVAESINHGYPFSAHHKDRRTDDNFICAGFIAVDIDHGWTLDEVLASPLVNSYGAIVYTTVNHTAEAHRLRVIFELIREINNQIEMRCALKGAIKYFDGDKACSAACQMFYGSIGCEPIVIGNKLPNDELEKLIKLGECAGAIESNSPPDKICSSLMPKGSKDDRKNYNGAPQRSAITLMNNQEVMTQNRSHRALTDLNVRTSVFCPIHADKHASAFVVENQSGMKGVHCRACNQSFWPEGHARPALLEYDFFTYEQHIDKLEYDEDPMMHLGNDAPPEYWDNDLRQVQRRNQKYLVDMPFAMGVTYVRSPKGTGKTTWLKQMVAECRATYKTVLVIGHRQLLLGELARSLGLHFYKDKVDYEKNDKSSTFQYLAICIDSMPHMLNTGRQKYDVVIIDESEQVFAHLVASTLAANRRKCYYQIEFFLRMARSVIVCDADLGFVTINTVERMIGCNTKSKLYVNSHKPDSATIDIYDSKNHLIVDMKQIVLDGGRHYICCNSKATARLMKEILVASGKSEKNIMLITSENSKDPEILEFLKEIKTAILDFDVLIASPSLGTGIDITFDEGAQLIDTTFGFFDANITTHFDLDQQLARVRHPKAVKAWVSPQISFVETTPSIIKEFCVTSRQVTDSLTGYDNAGHAEYKDDDKILTLYADVTSISNASKNNLKKHFIDLKLHNGWSINKVEKNDAGNKEITKNVRNAKDLMAHDHALMLINARQLSEIEFELIAVKSDRNTWEQLAYQRYFIEKFYNVPITADLIKLDNKGKFRAQLRMLICFKSSPFELAERDIKLNYRIGMDRENNSLKAELLQTLLPTTGLVDTHGNFNLDKEITSSNLERFVAMCVEKVQDIKNLLNISVRADIYTKPMAQLNSMLKLIGMKLKESKRTDDPTGKRTFFYNLDTVMHDLTMRYLPLANRDVDFEAKINEMSMKEKKIYFDLESKKTKTSGGGR